MICNKCNNECSEEDKFCSKCGSELIVKPIVEDEGKNIEEDKLHHQHINNIENPDDVGNLDNDVKFSFKLFFGVLSFILALSLFLCSQIRFGFICLVIPIVLLVPTKIFSSLKMKLTIILVIVMTAAGISLYKQNDTYNKAMIALQKNDFQTASTIFEQLGNFKDSETQKNEADYKLNLKLANDSIKNKEIIAKQ